MSLTASIKRKKEYELSFLNAFLEENMPQREQFTSNLGKKVFDTRYPLQVPKKSYPKDPGLIGKISELFIAATVGRYVDSYNEILYEIVFSVTENIKGRLVLLTNYRDSVKKKPKHVCAKSRSISWGNRFRTKK